MNNSDQILEKIDSFLTGKMTPIERTQFESEIATDPNLASEVQFQQQIIKSIKQNRMLELKSKLQTIEVSSKSRWLSQSFMGGAAATLALTIIGFTYLQYVKHDDNPHINAKNINHNTEYQILTKNTNTEAEAISSDNEIANTPTIDNSKKPENIEESITYDNVSAPNLSLNTEDDKTITNNSLSTLDNLESVEIMKSGAVDVEIEFKNTNAKSLAYKFYDQKLYLYGKFNTKNPYEVIEINTKFGKEFYLKFDKAYYTIQSGMVEKTPLTEIVNETLIEKLNHLN